MNQSICHGGAFDGQLNDLVLAGFSRIFYSWDGSAYEYAPNGQRDAEGRQILVVVRQWTRGEAEQLRGKIREAKR